MFDRIAPVYDAMNRVTTMGLDGRWRRLAAEAVVRPGDRVLDAACGTGDLAIAAARAGGRVTGLDFSERMLERARRKAPDDRVGRGRRPRAPVRGRELRRGHDRLRDPQRQRPGGWPPRAGARVAAGRSSRGARDHAPARAAAPVLPALVRRAHSARREAAAGRRGVHVPARERAPLPGPGGPLGGDWRARPSRTSRTGCSPAASSRSTPAHARERARGAPGCRAVPGRARGAAPRSDRALPGPRRAR